MATDPRRALGRATLAVALLLPAAAEAHDGLDARRVLVSVDEGTFSLLVAWDVPAGPMAGQIASVWNLDADPARLSPAERLAQAQTLLPRMRAGWQLELEGTPFAGRLSEFTVAPRIPEDPAAGFSAVALWTMAVSPGPLELSLRALDGVTNVRGEVQVGAPWQVRATELPIDAAGWLVGPFSLTDLEPAWIELESPG
jgi:hypothetical protein